MKFTYLFRIFMACLYIILGIFLISTKMNGLLENDMVRLGFSIILIAYGLFRAYTLSKERRGQQNN